MLLSMTGYASFTGPVSFSRAGQQGVFIELKTLNTRFFEVVVKLPSNLSSLELPITKILQEKLIRGRVYFNLRLDNKAGIIDSIAPSWSVVDQYLQATRAIKEKYNVGGDLSLAELIQLPNVLVAQESVLTAEDEQAILELVSRAADDVNKTRQQEGARLETDFDSIFKACANKIAIVEKEFDQAIAQQKEEIKQQMINHPPTADQPNQHLEELQSGLRKMDIHEEITRFKSHLASINPILSTKTPEKGKHIDFILQELLRETNTMMAKCPAYSVSAAGIEIKVSLEKAREQVQNIV